MRNPVNLTMLAIKVAICDLLTASIENDKNILKQYDKKEYKTQFLNIKINDKSRTSYTKETKKILDEIVAEKGLDTKTTYYKECKIETTAKADKEAQKAYKILENSTAKLISQMANQVND